MKLFSKKSKETSGRTRSNSQSNSKKKSKDKEKIKGRNDEYPLKILLLGAGESGKSTILKQIKLIYNKPFSAVETTAMKAAMRYNCMTATRTILDAFNTLGANIKIDTKTKAIIKKLERKTDAGTPLSSELAPLLSLFWQREPVREIWKMRSEFWYLDNTEYYLDNVERIAADDFELTERDIVLARVRTSGISTTAFESDEWHYTINDVGGQRSERHKWKTCFEDVDIMMFVVNLAGYSQRLFEDETEIRMHEALRLFEKVVGNPAFKQSHIVLVLNKRDIFERTLLNHPLSKCFREFKSVENQYETSQNPDELRDEAIDCIKQQFENIHEVHCASEAPTPLKTFVISASRRDEVRDMLASLSKLAQPNID